MNESEDYKSSIVRNKLLTMIGAMLTLTSMVLGAATFMYLPIDYVDIYSTYIAGTFICGVIFVLTGELFVNPPNPSSKNDSKLHLRQFAMIREEIASSQKMMSDLLEQHKESLIEERSELGQQIDLDQDEKKELFELLSKDVKSIVTKNLIDEIGNSQKEKIKHQDVIEFCEEFRNRLLMELSKLTGRANINLFIGSLTSVIGIAFLGYILIGNGGFQVNFTEDGMSVELLEYLLYYAPRLSLIVFVEIFSYFFLRLYKNTLEDIKYYQNELTNIDSNIAALRLSLLIDNEASIKKVMDSLLKVERNFVLKKGDTTVQLEVAKTEARKSEESLKIFQGIFTETKGIFSSLGSSKKSKSDE
ncbi:MAG: hypothetical protein ACI843_001323 [Psychrobacter glaciei]|jgi:hypothetical protein